MAPGGAGGPIGEAGMMFEPDMIGAIKIKDGLFIGDELASTVRTKFCKDKSFGPLSDVSDCLHTKKWWFYRTWNSSLQIR